MRSGRWQISQCEGLVALGGPAGLIGQLPAQGTVMGPRMNLLYWLLSARISHYLSECSQDRFSGIRVSDRRRYCRGFVVNESNRGLVGLGSAWLARRGRVIWGEETPWAGDGSLSYAFQWPEQSAANNNRPCVCANCELPDG